MNTEQLLNVLKRETPRFWELSFFVGKRGLGRLSREAAPARDQPSFTAWLSLVPPPYGMAAPVRSLCRWPPRTTILGIPTVVIFRRMPVAETGSLCAYALFQRATASSASSQFDPRGTATPC